MRNRCNVAVGINHAWLDQAALSKLENAYKTRLPLLKCLQECKIRENNWINL